MENPAIAWRLSVWGNPRAFTRGLEGMAAYVSDATDGQFAIEIVYGEALSKGRENLDGIALGAFEMAVMCVSYHPGKTPALSILDLPLIPYGSWDAQIEAFLAVFDHPYIREELARWNAMPVAAGLVPGYLLFGRGDVPGTLQDFEGMRVRALGGMGDAMQTVGAVPTTLPAPDVYTALERGTIDAAAFSLGSHVAYGIYEIADWYTTNLTLGTVNCPIVANIDAVDSLPPHYRDILLGDARDAGHAALIEAWEADESVDLPLVQQTNAVPVTFSEDDITVFNTLAGRPVWNAWIEEMSARGIPAQELFDVAFSDILDR